MKRLPLYVMMYKAMAGLDALADALDDRDDSESTKHAKELRGAAAMIGQWVKDLALDEQYEDNAKLRGKVAELNEQLAERDAEIERLKANIRLECPHPYTEDELDELRREAALGEGGR